MSSMMAQRHRTFAITLLAILAAFAGILSLLDAARYMGWLPIAVLGDIKFVLPQAEWFAALMAVLVAVIYFVVASWLWNLNPSGWLFVVIISIFNLIFLGLAILGKTSFGDVALQFAINAAVLILALLPSTKAAFRPAPSPEAVAAAADRIAGAKDAVVDQAQETATGAQAVATAAAVTAGDLVQDVADVTSDAFDETADAAAELVATGDDAAAAVLDVDIVQDDSAQVDLAQIEGIGPKITEVLQAAGIDTYAELADTSPEQLQQILKDAGISADPSAWAEQARLAAGGDWDGLKAFQEQLSGGRMA